MLERKSKPEPNRQEGVRIKSKMDIKDGYKKQI